MDTYLVIAQIDGNVQEPEHASGESLDKAIEAVHMAWFGYEADNPKEVLKDKTDWVKIYPIHTHDSGEPVYFEFSGK